ncbi:MAG: glycosyltransferase, partial [Rhodospirillales bacterium]|nr:glycosyltransferase [Rhodospirillales bacterium]
MCPASSPGTANTGVAILLSTFNGREFLPVQLNSFLAQTHDRWVLHWRDDGSSDDTVAIMRDFAARVGPDRCVESPSSGPHLGAAASFLTLLRESIGAMAVAFADQDDVWLPEKLHCAVEMLAGAGEMPALYCARQYLVDEALRGARLSTRYHGMAGFPACLT